MLKFFKSHWPAFIAVLALWGTMAVLVTIAVNYNDGHFIYALDDPYIHMAIAKNLVRHGVWGITPYGFSSASASILWPLLLAFVYLIFGSIESALFILNLIAATALVLLVYRVLRQSGLYSRFIAIALLALIYLTPLPSLIFSGQEHVLHTLLSIAFVYLCARVLASDAESEQNVQFDKKMLLVIAPLMVMTRYEGLFLLLVGCIMLLLRRRIRYSLLMGALAVLPVIIFGLISVLLGSHLLPNPVLLKGNKPTINSIESFIGLGHQQFAILVTNPQILVMLVAGVILLHFQLKRKRVWQVSTIMNLLFLAGVLLHVEFARTGWFFRYEAYLIAMAIFVVSASMSEFLPALFTLKPGRELHLWQAVAALFTILAAPFLLFLATRPMQQALDSLEITARASKNIYEHQYQTALFLNEFYRHESVAGTDIGAINYFADIKCLDLLGGSSLDVANAILENRFEPQQIAGLANANNVKIAVVYDRWFAIFGGVPSQWVKVGEWHIPDNVVCKDDKIAFYAVAPSEAGNLAEHLREFSPRLPKDIEQMGIYLSGPAQASEGSTSDISSVIKPVTQ